VFHFQVTLQVGSCLRALNRFSIEDTEIVFMLCCLHEKNKGDHGNKYM